MSSTLIYTPQNISTIDRSNISDAQIVEAKPLKSEIKETLKVACWWAAKKIGIILLWIPFLPFYGLWHLLKYIWINFLSEIIRRIVIYVSCTGITIWYLWLAIDTWSFKTPLFIMLKQTGNGIIFCVIWLFNFIIELVIKLIGII